MDNSDDKEKRMIPSNTLEEKAAFDRFSDLMAKMMIKHGPSLLKRRKERLIEAIRSSIEITTKPSTEEAARRMNAYHRAVNSCIKQ